MEKTPHSLIASQQEVASLFDRVAVIVDSARGRVIRTVNHETVTAYWLIGREIVPALQGGEARAEYGNAVITELSKRLTGCYGTGFSIANLKNFRQFYLAYAERAGPIGHPAGSRSIGVPTDANQSAVKSCPPGSQSQTEFHPNLSWSHCRALMRVENSTAQQFYEA